jgi:hypothetical protein
MKGICLGAWRARPGSWTSGWGSCDWTLPPRPGACDAGGGKLRRSFPIFSTRQMARVRGRFSAACDRALASVVVCARAVGSGPAGELPPPDGRGVTLNHCM